MVRHGRLSQGCQTCRTRKIKCDKALPACGQCLKAGWNCPKYGDFIDRMFQHKDRSNFDQHVNPRLPGSETQLKNRSYKLLISDGRSQVGNSNFFRRPSSTNLFHGHQLSFITLSPEIVPPISHRAIDFFLSTHVFRECGVPRGYYEYLSVFINGVGNSQRLIASLTAVALSAYAYTFKYPELLQEARRHYGDGLRLLNAALSSPEEIIESGTLSSVLLLNTFDTLTGQTIISFVPCISHMVAAMSILSLNGPSLVNSRTCVQLMLHVCWSLLQTSITCSTRIPEQLVQLLKYAAIALQTTDRGWELTDVVVKVANLRADVREGILVDRDTVVQAALDLDSELSSFADNMPAEWLFESVPLKEMSELVFGTCYHVYPDQWVAFIWNILRTCRVLLHEEIQNRLSEMFATSPLSLSYIDTSRYQNSKKTLHQMISEVCATVPQYSGYLQMLASDRTAAEVSGTSETIPTSEAFSLTNGIPTIAGAYLVLWPLLNAGQTTKSDIQRNWIVRRSRYIGKMTGIQQAFVFADVIERGDRIWQQTIQEAFVFAGVRERGRENIAADPR